MSAFISVIIPVFNDPEGLRDTIQSLIEQNCEPGEYEIIIADNGSTDQTIQTAEDLRAQRPALIQVIVEDEIRSSYAARNKGIRASKGEILCFIDADMTVESDYLDRVRKRFSGESVDYLGCRVELPVLEDTISAVYNAASDFKVQNSLSINHYSPTCCLCVRKHLFDLVGLFDDRLESGGDFDMGRKVHEFGLKQCYADDIVMYHPPRKTYRSLIHKGKRTARGCAQLAFFYPEKYRFLEERYFRLRRYLPRNPISWYKSCKAQELSITYARALVLAVFPIPIAFLTLLELLAEKRRLAGTRQRD